MSRKFKRISFWLFCRVLEEAFLGFLGLQRLLSRRLFQRATAPLLKLLIYFLLPRRRIIRNLAAAFGEAYSEATKKGLAKGVQQHFSKNLLDCILLMGDPEHIRDKVTIRGIENLQAALAKGNGVIALGAHIGNFVLVGTRLGMEGYPFHTLFRIPEEPRIKSVIYRILPRFYQRIIPSRPKQLAVRRVLEALKRNEIVFILADNLKKGKIQSVLFGRPVPSPRGPVSLALRTGAAVVPVYLIRGYEGGLRLIIEPEIPLHRNGNLGRDIAHNTGRIVGHLEELIRRYPDQWSWLTVRMKTKIVPVDSSLPEVARWRPASF